ncbi:hypothetical protein BU24DRAFT_488268 [Aaosphaeria arxii CBS 175.79]|uniref:Uncharacterized protein n=1 Tax=Aaosphaeria arxii CBS 175.79 TaxID=1450172 RepID=A0A6A5YBG2_9PLEO|nr:uncharacterized protein BU24DRAFT_488268 [Aaosphaeria arxii CBS 175.79]KAF2021954.1 hypothetical protein BU24DRAFT_488268 [Aaosphaeria arxii CBS 175.79]
MSALPRGFACFAGKHAFRLPCSIRIAIFSVRPQFAQARAGARLFTPPTIRQYVKATGRFQARASPTNRFVISDPVLRAVQQTRQPVLLYRAENRTLYTFGVYAFACSLVGAGLFTLRWGNELPRDLPFFVQPTYFVVSFIMLGIAAYIFSSPVSRCRSIEVIPGTLGGPVQLRIRARILPFFKDQVIVSPFGEVTLDQKTYPVSRELQEAQRARKQSITDGLEGMFIIPRMWEISARFLEQKWTSFFLRFKFAVLRFGIVYIEAFDRKWKIDCTGYLLEDGKALDRLVPEE